MVKNKKIFFLIVILLALLIINCKHNEKPIEEEQEFSITVSYHPQRKYPDYNELFFSGGKGYEFRNDESNKLLIVLEGGGTESAIGNLMVGRGIDYLLSVNELRERYTFFVPEKFNRMIGMNYWKDMEDLERYTIDNLLDNYYEVITEYLSYNDYESIVIFGGSEGGIILPLLYNRLDNKNIKALVSFAAGGGLTYYEETQILYKKVLSNDISFALLSEDKRAYNINSMEEGLQEYQTEPYPDSFERVTMTTTSRRYATSRMRLNLFEQLKKIKIPMLFMHGELDINIPVESTRAIEEKLPNNPFDFIYYPQWAHQLVGEQVYVLQRDITQWILRIDQ